MPVWAINILIQLLPVIGKLIADIANFLSKPGMDGLTVVERATQLATWHVQNMMQSTASGEDKRKMVRDALIADFKREGQVLEDSVLNMVIEIAYNGLKAATTPGTAPAKS